MLLDLSIFATNYMALLCSPRMPKNEKPDALQSKQYQLSSKLHENELTICPHKRRVSFHEALITNTFPSRILKNLWA